MTPLRSNLQRQRGAFSILSAATLVMAILFLALVVDSGRLYLEQRKLQKLADTAALESISRLESGNCALDTANAHLYAVENAASYGFVGNGQQSLTSSCVSISIIDGLRVPTADPAGGRAVRVVTRNEVPASIIVRSGGLFGLPGNSTVGLQAVAVAEKDREPMAVFSVGAQLLDLNPDGLLPRLLEGAGVNVTALTLLDPEGLANAQVTPGGLLQALGVEVGINQLKALTPNGLAELVDTQVGAVGIQQLINASAKLVTHNQTLAADINAFGEELVGTELENAAVNLISTADRPGLLQLASGPNQAVGSALDVKLNLGDVLSTGLMTAVQGRGLLVNEPSLLGLAKLQLGIVEPPSIGIGPVGTTARNAQIRLGIDVDTSMLVLSPLLGTSIKLPIIIDLADVTGELTNIDCSESKPTASIAVESRIANICLGSAPNETLWSTKTNCTTSDLNDATVFKLFNIDLIKGRAAIPLLSTGNPGDKIVTLVERESVETDVNDIELGTSVAGLIPQVLSMIKLGMPKNADGAPTFSAEQAGQIADKYLTTLNHNKVAIRERMLSDGLDWKRPAGLLNLGETTMPQDWYEKAPSNCSANKPACRSTLVTALQSKAQSGVLGSILDLVGGLVNGVLFGVLGENTQPLLLKSIDPLISLLKSILDDLGELLSSLLKTLGVELGKSKIKVHSISCGLPRLVQ
ncbi:pilus assembly protein TadG-related protein [Phytopseudomonas seleniipraecipitans]|uniref:Uncharacterized membrane protein n=1 Tax=Phytopseudomonas seleniipraecipitans TaxID=640205 RepID=A0A1G7USP2_9GAMM|nr:pilus assembly protein TadG-related protein [Pseudomonas seleniipraecipitans]SDG50524.1 Uncharacterized membrane protein [Pseudomonas seleniipraecipitans]